MDEPGLAYEEKQQARDWSDWCRKIIVGRMDCVEEDDFKYPDPGVHGSTTTSTTASERRFFRTSASLPRQTRAAAPVVKDKLRASEINLALANERASIKRTDYSSHRNSALVGPEITSDESISIRTSNPIFLETPKGSNCASSAASSNMSTPICRRHSSFQPITLSAEYANRGRPKCAPLISSPLASRVQLADSSPQQETKNDFSSSNEYLFEAPAAMKPKRDSLQNLHDLLAKRSEVERESENGNATSDKPLYALSSSSKYGHGEDVVSPPSNAKLSATDVLKKIADSNASIGSAHSSDRVVSSDSLTQLLPASSSSLTSKMINLALRSSFPSNRNGDAETSTNNNSLPVTPILDSYKWNDTSLSSSDLDLSAGSSSNGNGNGNGSSNKEPKVMKRLTPREINSPSGSLDGLAVLSSESSGSKPCKDESELSDKANSVSDSSDSMESSRPHGHPKATHKVLKGILKSRRNSSDDGTCSSDRSDSNNTLNLGRKKSSLMNSAISLIAGLSNNTAGFGSGSFDAYLTAYHESMVTASHLDQMEKAAAAAAPAPPTENPDEEECAEPRRFSTASRVKWGKSDFKIIQ
ncbi:hypothetical protein HDU77_005313 [Chytriomyces hyalinus]|nr:hypothetical protein HDU77_005313 [Chytriomyces hyalinus]